MTTSTDNLTQIIEYAAAAMNAAIDAAAKHATDARAAATKARYFANYCTAAQTECPQYAANISAYVPDALDHATRAETFAAAAETHAAAAATAQTPQECEHLARRANRAKEDAEYCRFVCKERANTVFMCTHYRHAAGAF